MVLKAIFQDKLIFDDRVPIFTAHFLGRTWGFFFPKTTFVIQLISGLVLSCICSTLLWAIIYFCIIPARNRGLNYLGYLVGFLIVIPINALFPIYFLDYVDIQNKVLRFVAAGAYSTLTFFRTSEAMYNFSPKGVESSFQTYFIYNASIFPIKYKIDDYGKKNDDASKTTKTTATANGSSTTTSIPQPMKSTSTSILTTIKESFKGLFIFGFFMSTFAYCNQEPFDTPINGNEPGYDLNDILDWKLFINNLIATMNFQLSLTTFTSVIAIFPQLLFGVQTLYVMHNPMLTSRSISEFWGERWNLVIHGALKRGVFKPMYQWSNSRYCAVLSTFFMSGLFHEYLLYVTMTFPGNVDYPPPCYGKNTAFMLWNAMTTTLEALLLRPLAKRIVSKDVSRRIPTFILSIYVLCTAMGIAHWFIHPYTKAGLFSDFEVGLPFIRQL